MKLDTNLIFDIGAHRGEDTMFYLLKGFRVVAVEANPTLIEILQREFAPALQSGQLILIDKILAMESFTTQRFYRNHNMSLWGTTHTAMVERNRNILAADSEALELETISLTELMQIFGVPYYLKVDIEGDDLMCIQQLAGVAPAERPHYISIESDKVNWRNLMAEFACFDMLGYDHFQVIAQHQVGAQTIPVPAREGQNIALENYKIVKDMTGLFGKDLPPESWQGKNATIRKYRKIFFQYWLNGDNGILNRWRHGKKRHEIQQFWDRLLGFEVGWYDTHARRRDIS
jgi:FkbM family methyltransferase